jgi:hypothetical protein
LNASENVVRSLAMLNRFWLGMTLGDAHLCDLHPPRALEVEGLGHHRHGEDVELLGDPGNDGSRTRAGAAAHARCDEHHVTAAHRCADLLQRLFGGGLTDLGLGSGAQPFCQGDAQLNAMLGGRSRKRLRVGVGDHELGTREPGCDHVVDGVASGTADADDCDLGFHARQSLFQKLSTNHCPTRPR